MAHYVDIDNIDAIKTAIVFDEKLSQLTTKEVREFLENMSRVLHKIPAANVREVKHAIWKWQFSLSGYNFYRCSECDKQVNLMTKYNVIEEMPYCHCGAKMIEEDKYDERRSY